MSITFFGFFLVGPIHAASIYHFDMNALLFLEEAKDSAIVGVEDGNVYLNSEKIFVEREGIFLVTRGNVLFKLAFVCSNVDGIYTPST